MSNRRVEETREQIRYCGTEKSGSYPADQAPSGLQRERERFKIEQKLAGG